jgi:hypothetical protein
MFEMRSYSSWKLIHKKQIFRYAAKRKFGQTGLIILVIKPHVTINIRVTRPKRGFRDAVVRLGCYEIL